MGSYIGLAVLIYVISGVILFIYAMSEDGTDMSIHTIFCPVINTIAVFIMVIKFIIKAIKGLIELIIKL